MALDYRIRLPLSLENKFQVQKVHIGLAKDDQFIDDTTFPMRKTLEVLLLREPAERDSYRPFASSDVRQKLWLAGEHF